MAINKSIESAVIALTALGLVRFGCAGGRTEAGVDASPTQDGSSDASACVTGAVEFALRALSPQDFCTGKPNSCSPAWLTVLDPSGQEVAVDRPCLPDCSSCEPYGCPASCAIPTRMTESGVKRPWDGTYFASGSCGGGSSCVAGACAMPGRYTARMCAYRDFTHQSYCQPTSIPTCVDVKFDWPPAQNGTKVEGVIPSAIDAGACCPDAWSLIPCTYPDGGAGAQCHNPALGCASSDRCGEGCDFIVVGRCGDRD